MNYKENLPESEDIVLVIPTDYRLWSLLFQDMPKKHLRRLTRPQAFFDLIKRHRMAVQIPGQTIAAGGYQELAESWGWDRTTVRRFIQNLADIGVVSTETTPQNCTVIRLPGVTTAPMSRNDAGHTIQGHLGDSG